MEILIVLVVMVIVSVLVFTQLKGTKPPVVSALDHGVRSRSKKSPRKQEAKKNTEKWDEPEPVAPRSDSPSKKKNKKRFDPVAEGQRVVRSAMTAAHEVKQRKQTEEEIERQAEDIRKAKKSLAVDGFVMVEDKKKVRAAASPTEEVKEAKPAVELSTNDLILQRIQQLKEGTYKSERREPTEQKSSIGAKAKSMEEVAKELEQRRAEQQTQKAQKGAMKFKVGKVNRDLMSNTKAPSWANSTFPPAKEAEPEKEEVEQEAEPEVEDHAEEVQAEDDEE